MPVLAVTVIALGIFISVTHYPLLVVLGTLLVLIGGAVELKRMKR